MTRAWACSIDAWQPDSEWTHAIVATATSATLAADILNMSLPMAYEAHERCMLLFLSR